MSRPRRYSFSSFFNKAEPSSSRRYSFSSFFGKAEQSPSGTPVQKKRRFSLFTKQRTKEPITLKAKVAPEEDRPLGDPPTAHAYYLATLDSLPPLSPEGCQFEAKARQGQVTYADVAGENFSRWLQDGLPDYELAVGQEKADRTRRNIEMWIRNDLEEIHDLVIPGTDIYYMSEMWAPSEKNNASVSPMAIATQGVTVNGGPITVIRGSEDDLPIWASALMELSAVSARMREQEVCSSNHGKESSICPTSSDTFDDKFQSLTNDSDEEQDDGSLNYKGLEDIPVPFEKFTILDTFPAPFRDYRRYTPYVGEPLDSLSRLK